MADADALAPAIRVTLVWSPGPRRTEERELVVAPGTTARQVLDRYALAAGEQPGLGVWGRKIDGAQVLRDGDRLELYRNLKADPKAARRERFGQQGARGTGLFAKKTPGARRGG